MAKKIEYSELVNEQGLKATITTLDLIIAKLKEVIDLSNKTANAKGTGNYKEISEKTKAINEGIAAAKAAGEAEKQRIGIEKELLKLEQEQIRTEKLKNKETQTSTSIYKQQSDELNRLRKAYKDLALQNKANTTEGKAMLKNIQELDSKLKAVDATVGQHQRNVGNYKEAVKGVNLNLGEMRKELIALRNTSFAGKSEEEVKALKLRIGQLMDGMRDLKTEMQVLGTEKAAVLVSGLKFIAAGVEGVVGSLSIMGVESDVIKKLESKMTSLIAVTQALAEIEDVVSSGKLRAIGLRIQSMALDVKDTVQKWASVVATTAQEKAEDAKAIATGKGNLIVRAAAAVQWLWNAALAANPIGLVVAGVVALVAGITLLVFWTSKSTDKQRDYNKELKNTEDSYSDLADELDYYTAKLEKSGAKESDIIKKKIENSRILTKELYEQLFLAEMALSKAKENNESDEKISEARQKRDEIEKKITKAERERTLLRLDLTATEKKEKEKANEDYQKLLEKRKKAIEEQNKAELKIIEELIKIYEQANDKKKKLDEEKAKKDEENRNKEIEDSINNLRKKYKITYDSEQEINDIRTELFKNSNIEDKKVKQKAYEENKALLDAALRNNIVSQKEYNQLLFALNKEQHDKEAKQREQALKIAETFAQQMNEKKQKALDKEISARERHQSTLRELAARGSENAKDNLALEEANIIKAQAKKEKLAKRQRQLEEGFALLNAYNSAVSSGKKPMEALTETVVIKAALDALIKSIPAFREGIEDTGEGGNIDKDKGMLAILHPKERVVDAENNAEMRGLSNKELALAANLYKKNSLQNIKTDEIILNQQLLSELRNVKSAIENQKQISEIDFDKQNESVIYKIETKSKIIRNHIKLNKLS